MDGTAGQQGPNGDCYQGVPLNFTWRITNRIKKLQYSGPWKQHDNTVSQKVHYIGNGSKARHLAINASLKRLRTDYIDIFYVHFYDWETSVEELMTNLHNLVISGKVLHLVSFNFRSAVHKHNLKYSSRTYHRVSR